MVTEVFTYKVIGRMPEGLPNLLQTPEGHIIERIATGKQRGWWKVIIGKVEYVGKTPESAIEIAKSRGAILPEVTPALERQRLITAAKEELSLLRSGLRRLEKERASEYTLKVQREGIIEAEQKIKQLQKLEVAIPTPPVVPTALSKQVIAEEGYHSNPEEKLPSDHELLLHFGIEEVGSPGVVLDEARARATPCSCFTYKSKDYCWSRGIIGLLKPEQQEIYCVAGKTYKAQPALTERYTRFAEAAKEAHKKIEAMPKGRERLMAWLAAMGEELSKRAIEV
ncbi:hypothetical protein ES703_29272 [subsurface metagenome]